MVLLRWEMLWVDWEVDKNLDKYPKKLGRNGEWNNGVTEAGMREPVDGGAESGWSQNDLKACWSKKLCLHISVDPRILAVSGILWLQQSYPAFTFNIFLKKILCL